MPRLFATLFGLCFTFIVVTAFAQHGEAMLEGRLLAPCCWTQTLDIHESPLATELRTEIHGRLDQGESAEVIEEDLVARYGERIRAIPKGHDPRAAVSFASAGAMLLSAIGLLWLLRRWTRPRMALAAPRTGTRDEYDARLDDELRELDHP
ncbi:cytochrome c-type biogenesis protein CcmH [Pendulispora brunnea]|uniref:Cytochrome c-type biogenesis protein n=1 Tax=Pendulispora brunnea TaxID=2905690 RepID=A0ABZ2KM41_9BACT